MSAGNSRIFGFFNGTHTDINESRNVPGNIFAVSDPAPVLAWIGQAQQRGWCVTHVSPGAHRTPYSAFNRTSGVYLGDEFRTWTAAWQAVYNYEGEVS